MLFHIFIFLSFSSCFYADQNKQEKEILPIPIFAPPHEWQCAQSKKLSSYVKVGFIGKGSTPFNPSINLAIEEIDISQKEYIKAVKEVHLSEPNTTWRNLGKFSMKAGMGNLSEISSSSPWGDIKMLQAIFVQGKTAYILTAAVLKKEYPKFQKEIIESLRSFSLQPDLIHVLPDEQQKPFNEIFTSLGHFEGNDLQLQQKAQWEQLNQIVAECTGAGNYWRFLILQEGHEKIYNRDPSKTAQGDPENLTTPD